MSHMLPQKSVLGEGFRASGRFAKVRSNARVVSILKEGYTLPFRERPPLSHFPLVVSKYANAQEQVPCGSSLLPHSKASSGKGGKSSLAFYNHLCLVPKPNRKWRPILDLSKLNLFLETGTFKMETRRPKDCLSKEGNG